MFSQPTWHQSTLIASLSINTKCVLTTSMLTMMAVQSASEKPSRDSCQDNPDTLVLLWQRCDVAWHAMEFCMGIDCKSMARDIKQQTSRPRVWTNLTLPHCARCGLKQPPTLAAVAMLVLPRSPGCSLALTLPRPPLFESTALTSPPHRWAQVQPLNSSFPNPQTLSGKEVVRADR